MANLRQETDPLLAPPPRRVVGHQLVTVGGSQMAVDGQTTPVGPLAHDCACLQPSVSNPGCKLAAVFRSVRKQLYPRRRLSGTFESWVTPWCMNRELSLLD